MSPTTASAVDAATGTVARATAANAAIKAGKAGVSTAASAGGAASAKSAVAPSVCTVWKVFVVGALVLVLGGLGSVIGYLIHDIQGWKERASAAEGKIKFLEKQNEVGWEVGKSRIGSLSGRWWSGLRLMRVTCSGLFSVPQYREEVWYSSRPETYRSFSGRKKEGYSRGRVRSVRAGR